MANRTPTSSGPKRSDYPNQDIEQPAEAKSEETNPVAANWNSGMAQIIENDSESIVIHSSDCEERSESSNFSENSSASDASDREWGNRAASKMNTRNTSQSEGDHAAANKTQSHQRPSKFCLVGTGTSLGFSAAVAGFTATAFLYDLMTRFPEKATTEIGAAFGASIAIALGGTLTCSTSMVFMIRELCKTSSD